MQLLVENKDTGHF